MAINKIILILRNYEDKPIQSIILRNLNFVYRFPAIGMIAYNQAREQ